MDEALEQQRIDHEIAADLNPFVALVNELDEGPDELVPLLPRRVPHFLVLLLHQPRDPAVVGLSGVVGVQPTVRSRILI